MQVSCEMNQSIDPSLLQTQVHSYTMKDIQ